MGGSTLLTAREAAEYLHVSIFTLGKMEKEGLLSPFRTPGGHRRYSLRMLNDYLERSRLRGSCTAGRDKRVLLVDEPGRIDSLIQALGGGYRIASASDPFQIGLRLAEFAPSLVIINIATPHIEGPELCQQVKREKSDLKVLALGPGGEPPPGADAYLSNLEGLRERVEDLLGERSSGEPSNV